MDSLVTIGAYARVDEEEAVAVRRRLNALAGVETFELDEPGKVGLLIEALDLERANSMIKGDIRETAGVLGVWPVYADFDDQTASPTGETTTV